MIFYPTSLWVVALYLPATEDDSHPYFVPSWSTFPMITILSTSILRCRLSPVPFW